jgi:hypothetical protein
MQEQNYKGNPDFEGYSLYEMHQILYFTFGPESPIKIQELSDSDYKKIPLLNQVKYLMELINENQEIKLTKNGYLPTKIVANIYDQGFFSKGHVESNSSKLYKETDLLTVNLSRILLELSRLTKKRYDKLSLTKSGEKIINDNEKLLKTILETYATKFNWPYLDPYYENLIGQLGYGFSLILLSKYGNEKRLDSFYARKYFNAFPHLLDFKKPAYGTIESYSTACYSMRTFSRFLELFGLINIEDEGEWPNRIRYVTKTELFDRLIECKPHGAPE